MKIYRTGPHYGATLRLALPIAIGQLGTIVLGFADTIMVGRYATDALAAASFVTNLFNLVQFLLMGYTYGLTPLVSAACGRGETARAASLLAHALAAGTLFCLVLMGGMTWLYFNIGLLGPPEALLPLVQPYYLQMLVSMLFVLIFNMLRQFTDGTSDTASGMWVLLTGNALNIVGNWLLIYGRCGLPELGLGGAGLATLLARAAMAAGMAGVVLLGGRYAPVRRAFRSAGAAKAAKRLTLAGLRHINARSLPVAVQMGLETLSFSAAAVMAGWMGGVELASFQILNTIGMLGFIVYYSFGAGMSIRMAHFWGRGDRNGLEGAARAGRNLLLALMMLASGTFLLFGRGLTALFTTDAAVAACCLTYIGGLALYQAGDALQICYASALRATSHVAPMMWMAAVSYLGVGIPTGYLCSFPLGLGMGGIYAGFLAGLLTAAALFAGAFRRTVRHAFPAGR
ncbi:MAG: MATE family efflux transporter [Prevotellaceae bacterium]|nr:MATE family efflux transporter [Prevotellaceae bacterium]